jgi:hypothetical protein
MIFINRLYVHDLPITIPTRFLMPRLNSLLNRNGINLMGTSIKPLA